MDLDLDTLTTEYVRSLPTWNVVARTAKLPDGRKVREHYDSTSGRVWYTDTKPSAAKAVLLAAERERIGGLTMATTPEEDFGADERKRGGHGEPA
jgi:hypothetical protein